MVPLLLDHDLVRFFRLQRCVLSEAVERQKGVERPICGHAPRNLLRSLTGVPYDPIYSANKHGVVGLVRSLGPGLAVDGIRINAVCPGFADTPIVDGIREGLAQQGMPLIDPEIVARTVVHLFAADSTGDAWFIQPGREPAAFAFRGIPGPRAPA